MSSSERNAFERSDGQNENGSKQLLLMRLRLADAPNLPPWLVEELRQQSFSATQICP